MWSPARRVVFRFACVFVPMLCVEPLWLALPLRKLPHLAAFDELLVSTSSDSTFGWRARGVMVLAAAIAAALWSWRARATEYDRLADRLHVLVRYSLAAAMVGYGLEKVFLLQFWQPTPTDLAQTYGDSSPFALAWRFVGYSAPYTMFGGALETIGAALLLWRRTATLGAVVLIGVLGNVVMLNLSYAITVKLYSLSLLALAFCVLAPDAERLLAFARNRRVEPVQLRPFPQSPRGERVRKLVKVAAIAVIVGWEHYHCVRVRSRRAILPALWGVYDVEAMQRDGAPVQPAFGDAKVWQQVVFGRAWGPSVLVVKGDQSRHQLWSAIDEAHRTLTLSDDDGKHVLDYVRPDASHLELRGHIDGDDVVVKLHLRDHSWHLLEHEFSWTEGGGDWD